MTTIFADTKRRRATAVVKNQGLAMIFEIIRDRFKERVAEIAVFTKFITVFKINNFDMRRNGGFFGFFGEGDKGIFGFGEVVIGEGRGGGTENARDI